MRTAFDGQLKELSIEMAAIGGMCEDAIARAARAFIDGDLKLAGSVQEIAATLAEKEREIEEMCLKLLLKQQPIAKDLRIISAALKMVTDMERIGIQSADIAEIVITAGLPAKIHTEDFHDMALAVIKMVTDSVEAFLNSDVEAARAVIEYDDIVDDFFVRIKDGLTESLREKDTIGDYMVDLVIIAKYLERIGDHAVNIGKWVIFSVTGEL